MGDAIHFHWDKHRTWRGMVLLLALGAPGLLLAFQDGVDAKLLGLVWSAAFGFLAAAVYRCGAKTEPVVTVSEEGIHDKRVSATPIPWDRIARIEGFEAENVTFVGLDFHDPKVALADSKPLVRVVAPIHRLFRFPAVSINTSLLDGGDADLIAAIKKFRPSLLHDD
jgi:hypothetical protein